MSSPSDRNDWDHHWSNMHGAARRNPAQDFRRRVILGHIRRLIPPRGGPLRVLDIGCGTGDFARDFLDAFPAGECLGVDASAVGIELCRRKVPEALFEQVDLLNPGPVDPRFQGWATAAVCSEVLEHLDEPELVLENAKPYLAPGAPLIVTVPGGPMSAFDRHIGHRQHFTNRQLRSLLARTGYQALGIWGAGFPFFNLYRLTVIARGKNLIADVSQPVGSLPLASRAAMTAFGVLFRLNRHHSSLGWQRVAVSSLAAPASSAAALEASHEGLGHTSPPKKTNGRNQCWEPAQ
jgi:SAM-dependent methyltransferase